SKNVFDLARKAKQVALSPDGRVVAVITDGLLRLWDFADGEELFVGQWPSGTFTAVTFTPDSKTLAAGDKAGMVTLWDVSTRSRLTQLDRRRKHDRSITTLVFSPSGNELALCGGLMHVVGSEWPDRIVKVWEVSTGRDRGSVALPVTSDSWISRVAFDPNGKTLAVVYGKPYSVGSP